MFKVAAGYYCTAGRNVVHQKHCRRYRYTVVWTCWVLTGDDNQAKMRTS